MTPGARSKQEEQEGRNIGRMSVAELCPDPSKKDIQHSPRLVPKGSFQALLQALLCKKLPELLDWALPAAPL